MRLFVAVEFDEATKDGLYAAVEALREASARGSFTRRENLHLTLVFIGETGRVEEAKRALELIEGRPFPLRIAGLGKFSRPEGDVRWIGVEGGEALRQLYERAYAAFAGAGFPLENRPYRPHLTLGRRVVLRGGADWDTRARQLPPVTAQVDRIALLCSWQEQGGVLRYTPLHRKRLGADADG